MEELQDEFTGTGDVKGFKFRQIRETPYGYIYQVSITEDIYHFEVFKRVEVYKYDFVNQVQLDAMKVSYPSTKQFGKTAWCCNSFNRAEVILKRIEDDERNGKLKEDN